MKCEECLPLLEEYFDRELDEGAATLVGAHLSACASCAREYRRLEREQDLYLAKDFDLQVSPAFWPRVFERAREEDAARGWGWLGVWLARISGEIGALRFGPLLTTAIVLVAIGATSAVMRYLHSYAPAIENPGDTPAAVASPARQAEGGETVPARRDRDDPGAGGGDRPSGHASKQLSGQKEVIKRRRGLQSRALPRRQTPEALVREAEQKYLTAIALLLRDANRRRSRFDPRALAQLDEALAEVDRLIAGTRRAVRARPDDPVAVQYMLAAYAKKVDVLRQMASN